MTIDYAALRALAQKALEDNNKWHAEHPVEIRVEPISWGADTVLALLDERDKLWGAIHQALDMAEVRQGQNNAPVMLRNVERALRAALEAQGDG